MSANRLPPDVQAALRQGNKIEAVKLLRIHTRMDLKSAKDIIDAAATEAPAISYHSPSAVPHSAGFPVWIIVLMAVMVYLGYSYVRG